MKLADKQTGELTHDNTTNTPRLKSGFAKEQLNSFVERIERLQEEIDALQADKREVFAEAKGMGFDAAIMRKVISLRKMDKAAFQEFEAVLDTYLTALDMR